MCKSNNLGAAVQRFKNWCIDDALPFWMHRGRDPNGGFYERLSPDGRPDVDALRRVRVQARLLYCFSHAHALGWCDGRDVANHLSAYILDKGVQGGPDIPGKGFNGIAHLLKPDGRLENGMRDTYAQAFVILSYAWKYKAFNDPADLNIARDTVLWLDNYASAPSGGWVEAVNPRRSMGSTPAPDPGPRRQNPHMHLFEALMALHEISGDAHAKSRADHVYHLFTDKIFDKANSVILEYFDEDWNPINDGKPVIEPGHMMEWSWLLVQYQMLTGVETVTTAKALYESAVAHGLNQKTGLLYDEVRLGGEITKPTSRSWPMTEYIKASLALAEMANDQYTDYQGQAAVLINRLMDSYLVAPIAGAWRDQYCANGEAVAGPIQASTFYHLFCAVAEADRIMTKLTK